MGEPIGRTLFRLFLFLLLLLATFVAAQLGRAEVINGRDYQNVETIFSNPSNAPKIPVDGPRGKGIIANPQAMAMGPNGTVYIADGVLLRKLENGVLTTVASLANDKDRLARWNLAELRDVATLKVASMVYQDGAIYLYAFMLDKDDSGPRRKYQPQSWPPDQITSMRLGRIYYVFFKVTDHFEPLLVEKVGTYEPHIEQYEGSLMNSENFLTRMNRDYVFFDNYAWPNLVPAGDGSFYVLKNAAKAESYLKPGEPGANQRALPLTEKDDWDYKPLLALFKVWPDGRQEILSDAPMSDHTKTAWYSSAHAGEWYPNAMCAKALPSKRPNTVIINSYSGLQYYNWQTNAWEDIDYYNLSNMGSLDIYEKVRPGFAPTTEYIPLYAQHVPGHGIYFLYPGKPIWRLYDEYYVQGLVEKDKYPGEAEDFVDWTIAPDGTTIYTLWGDCIRMIKIKSKAFADLAAASSADSDFQADGRTFCVKMKEKPRVVMDLKSDRGPFSRDGRLYLPIDPIVEITGAIYDWKSAGHDQVITICGPTSLTMPLRVETYDYHDPYTGWDYIIRFSEADELFRVLGAVTGEDYRYSYDPLINWLYIEKWRQVDKQNKSAL